VEFLSGVKLLAGAVVLRTLETYRLLLTRFWWLLALFFGSNFIVDYALRITLQSVMMLTFISIIILLSRSSMVRKDWKYIFFSNQTISILLWNFICLLIVKAVGLKMLFHCASLYAPGLVYIMRVTLPAIATLWAYYLLDNQMSWGNILYIIPKSMYECIFLLWRYPLVLLLLFVVVFLFFYILLSIHCLLVGISMQHFLTSFIILLLFSWCAASLAVLYEEMRYRAGV
jgi:hypothetical protein